MLSAYTVEWLGLLDDNGNISMAQAINDAGQVVGLSGQMTGSIMTWQKAFQWSPGTRMSGLGTLGGTSSAAADINNAGTIVGWAHGPYIARQEGSYENAFIYENGVMSPIPGLQLVGAHHHAYGINELGHVVGEYSGVQPQHAILYDGTTVHDLSAGGFTAVYALDINTADVVVGFGGDGHGQQGYRWENGTLINLGALGGINSSANALNEAGQIVGWAEITPYGTRHAFLYDGGTMTDLGSLWADSAAYGINDLGMVVGSSGVGAFVYDGTMHNLNDLIPAGSGYLYAALDINNGGQIVGYGLHNGIQQAFVLTPIGTGGLAAADAGGPYVIAEGDSLTLDASASYDPNGNPLSYSWDINGDGTFGDALGVNPTLTWAGLQALGISDGPSSFYVRVRTDDGLGHQVTSPAVLLTVANVAPTPSLSGPSDGFLGVAGQVRTFAFQAHDPSPIDEQSPFTYAVNWGDGQVQYIGAWSGFSFDHVYDQAGSYVVSVTATDRDGATSAPATLSINILSVEVQNNTLAVGGTVGDDRFVFAPGSGEKTVAVTRNGVSLGTFFAEGGVKAYGGAGSDSVTVRGTASADLFMLRSGVVSLQELPYAGDVELLAVDGLAGDDRFFFDERGGFVGAIEGGAGNDRLDFSSNPTAITVNLQTRTISGG